MNKPEFKVIKEKDDPICDRISLGGNINAGYYLVYRGSEDHIEHILNEASKAFSIHKNKIKNFIFKIDKND